MNLFEKPKLILKINGFTYDKKLKSYIRDDGIALSKSDYGFEVILGNGDTIPCKSIAETIGFLAIQGIINRLF